MLCLCFDPAFDFGMKNVERQRAAAQNLIVKSAQVELVTELLAGFLA